MKNIDFPTTIHKDPAQLQLEFKDINQKRLNVLRSVNSHSGCWLTDFYINEVSTEDHIVHNITKESGKELSFRQQEEIIDASRRSFDKIKLPSGDVVQAFIINIKTKNEFTDLIQTDTSEIKRAMDPEESSTFLLLSGYAMNSESFPIHGRSDYGNYLISRLFQSTISGNYDFLVRYPNKSNYLRNKSYFLVGFTNNFAGLKSSNTHIKNGIIQSVQSIPEYSKSTERKTLKNLYRKYISQKKDAEYYITITTTSSNLPEQTHQSPEVGLVMSSTDKSIFIRPISNLHTLVLSLIAISETTPEIDVFIVGYSNKVKKLEIQTAIEIIKDTDSNNLNFLFKPKNILDLKIS